MRIVVEAATESEWVAQHLESGQPMTKAISVPQPLPPHRQGIRIPQPWQPDAGFRMGKINHEAMYEFLMSNSWRQPHAPQEICVARVAPERVELWCPSDSR